MEDIKQSKKLTMKPNVSGLLKLTLKHTVRRKLFQGIHIFLTDWHQSVVQLSKINNFHALNVFAEDQPTHRIVRDLIQSQDVFAHAQR